MNRKRVSNLLEEIYNVHSGKHKTKTITNTAIIAGLIKTFDLVRYSA